MIRTPTQQRAWDELLAVHQPRPAPDPSWCRALRARVADAALQAASHLAEGDVLRINKTALDALNCDGRYLDLRAQPFAWSVRLLAGKLAHRAIELDHAGGFQRPVGDVVTHAWMETATDRGSAARFAAELAGVAADSLRDTVTQRVITFRESFPVLPPSAEVRAEKPYTVRLADGRVELRGVPDLVLGRATATQRRVLLVDLKTGGRSRRHLHDMRFFLRPAGDGRDGHRAVPRGHLLSRRGGVGARGHRVRPARGGRPHGRGQGGTGRPARWQYPPGPRRPAARGVRRLPVVHARAGLPGGGRRRGRSSPGRRRSHL
ncbi:MAG: hypothetical protein KY460_04280 [Actinobacteria bacterium]|nr:hypothetical protein [Actinomycetota bacterium]